MPIPWKWLKIDGWKSHGLPAYLVHSLVDDLNARAEADGGPERMTMAESDLKRVHLYMPGFSLMDMPTLEFQVDGLTIEIPAHDVGTMHVQLQNARRRTFKHGGGLGVGMDYYKFHGHCRCLVLTPDVRAHLLEQMEANSEEANRIADALMSPLRRTKGS
jgi:hypothetical protein